MVDTALTIITDALLDLGVIADEETPTASQAVGGLRKLNNMIDSWNIDSLMVYGATSHVLPLVNGQGIYTVGPGGDLDITRPTNIENVFVRDVTLPVTDRMDIPVYMATDAEWQSVSFKSQQATYPFNAVWVDNQFPLISLYFNPVPDSSEYSAVIWVSGMVSNLTLYQAISLAPGYKRALTANLAIELAASYQAEVPATIQKIAVDSVALIKKNNVQYNEMQLPYGLVTGYYDILTGRYS